MEIKQGRSLDLTHKDSETLRLELTQAKRAFAAAGGRGIDLAEFIDCARFELRSRRAKKAALTRANNNLKRGEKA